MNPIYQKKVSLKKKTTKPSSAKGSPYHKRPRKSVKRFFSPAPSPRSLVKSTSQVGKIKKLI